MIAITTHAVEAFADRDLSVSACEWDELVHKYGPSKLAEFYHRAIADPESNADGVLRLRDK